MLTNERQSPLPEKSNRQKPVAFFILKGELNRNDGASWRSANRQGWRFRSVGGLEGGSRMLTTESQSPLPEIHKTAEKRFLYFK